MGALVEGLEQLSFSRAAFGRPFCLPPGSCVPPGRRLRRHLMA